MSKNKLFATFLALVMACTVAAQTKTFSIDDIFTNRDLYADSYTELKWIGNSSEYCYLDGNALMAGTTGNEEDRILVSLEKLNLAIAEARGTKVKRFPHLDWTSDTQFLFFSENELFSYDINSGKAVKLADCGEDAENTDIAPLTNSVAFTVKNNLYVSFNAKVIAVTADPDTGIVSGQVVHRNEWGIEKGTFWSPNGKLLAYYRMDESMVTQYPLVDISVVPAVVEYTRYPMAGMASHRVKVGVFDPATEKTVFLETGEPTDQFLTNVCWTPDSKNILIAVLNREQNNMWLRMYDATTGAYVKTLFEETDEQYVEPQHAATFLHKTPNQFLWLSERDGFMHIYLYDLNGTMIKQLTQGPWEVNDLLGLGDDDKLVWFTAGKESPLCKDLYNVDIKTAKITRVTQDEGRNNVTLSADQSLFIDAFSSLSVASVVKICSANGKDVKELLRDENPLKNYKVGTTKLFTIKSNLDDDLYCRMILPPDFNESKRYPVVVYVYGGPHNQLVTNSWLGGSGLFLNYLATKGYIVFTLDNHGTYNRGQEFEQVIHRQVGIQEVMDQMKGVEYLRALPYVDRNRIAVHGWSYGGFLTLMMLESFPNDFKVGVAGGPVCNWKYYEVMYGERYMDTPQENPTNYEQTAVTNYVDQLKADLLIIHGSMDPTVVQQNSLEFIQQCVKKDIPVDYFIYPGQGHNMGGVDRMHLYKKIAGYIEEKL